jgi:hypothetical protein
MSVVFTVFQLLGEGVFKVLAPDLYGQVIQAKLNKQPTPDLLGSSVPLISSVVLVAGFFALSVWGLVAWGAYRELNGLTKRRSFVALMIAGLLGWLIAAVVFFIQSAMMVRCPQLLPPNQPLNTDAQTGSLSVRRLTAFR